MEGNARNCRRPALTQGEPNSRGGTGWQYGSASRPIQLLGCGWSVVTTSVVPGVSARSTANVHGDQASPWKYVGLPRSRQR